MFPARENRAVFYAPERSACVRPIRIHSRSRRAAPFPKVACARLPSLNACRAVRIVRGGVPGFETVGGSVETAAAKTPEANACRCFAP